MPLYCQGGDIDEILSIPPEKTVILDTETTGLDPSSDEILQISILDGYGNILMSTYIRPSRAASWPEAEKVNQISPAMVADAPVFEDVADRVSKVIRSADLLVGYNLSFDLGFIRAAGVKTRQGTLVFDVMKEFAPVAGVWNPERDDWKWQKLVFCAEHYGYSFAAHDSLEDARATLHCFRSMLADENPNGYLAIAEGSFDPWESLLLEGRGGVSAAGNHHCSGAARGLLAAGAIMAVIGLSAGSIWTVLAGMLLVGVWYALYR